MEHKVYSLNDVMFPLVKKDVFAEIEKGQYSKIPGKKVLINTDTMQPVSIIGSGYEIITNAEAYEYGRICMKTLFKKNGKDDIKLFNIITPNTKSFCHIDLTFDTEEFEALGERFIPFVRVTNSYNKMFRLSFKIGVCRWICKNGMIFDDNSITFKYIHSKGFKRKLDFNIHSGDFEKILNKFKSNLELLKEKQCPAEYSFPVFCKALGLQFDLNNENEQKKSKEKEKLENYRSNFKSKLNKYVQELGDNFYALYNVLTEIGTFGFNDDTLFITRVNSRQARAGNGLIQISELLRAGDINYDDYLKDYLELLKN